MMYIFCLSLSCQIGPVLEPRNLSIGESTLNKEERVVAQPLLQGIIPAFDWFDGGIQERTSS